MELSILKVLKNYSKLKPVRFHMPGHKADKNFNKLFRQAEIDITELAFSDNLDNPNSVILKTQQDIAEIIQAKASFILTDGSTSGVYAMLKAVKKFGKKIIINRNSHKSVYNACELLNIEPYVLSHNYKHGIVMPPAPEQIENMLKKDDEIIGVLLTSPDYFGNVIDYEQIRQIVNKYKKFFLVDGAHGAHLKFCDERIYAGKYADIWVDGAHKTLPALTQGAVVSAKNEVFARLLSDAVRYFRTTSPSYPIMASVEYGFKYAQENKASINELKDEIRYFKKKLAVKNYRFFNSEDFLKLAVDFKYVNVSTDIAEKYLMSKKIYCELNDGRYLLFYLSVTTSKKHLYKLEKYLKKIARNKKFKNTFKEKSYLKTAKKSFSFLVAREMDSALCPIEKTVGKICGKNAGVFPPCFPVIVAGEEITKEAVELLSNRKNIFGIENNKINVLK